MDKFQPDEPTKDRIKNLAEVGIALMQATNDDSYQTNFYAAKESLKRFEKGIDALNLDPESLDGMKNLIKYLDKKIDRRLEISL